MTQWLAALDQGTTSTRCMIFDAHGSIVAAAQKEHRQIFPQPGWVEHDALEIWRNSEAVIDEAVARSKLSLKQCAGIGITNQRETALLWDRRTGVPLANALVWQDSRVNEAVARYAKEGHQERVKALTGLPLASYFSALKLQWLLDNTPDARVAAEAGNVLCGTIDAWLVWKLTGRHLTDVTNASRTQLMNLATLAWDDALLELFRIPREMLPGIASSSGEFGVANCTSLKGVSVCGVLGDQQAALVGQACFNPGEAKNTYGTGCFMLLNTGEQVVASKAGLLSTVAYKFGDRKPCYALEGSIAMAGALVQWLRDNLRLIETSAAIEALAQTVTDNGDVYLVPAFSGLYAPYWREDARGVIAGLTRFANRGHIARAALEATAYQTRDVLMAMEADSGIKLSELRVDGGMVVNELLMQFQADMLGVPVVRPEISETTALGAAYAAGIASGVWRDLSELKSQWRAAKRWSPAMPAAERNKLYASWKKAVQRSLEWIAP